MRLNHVIGRVHALGSEGSYPLDSLKRNIRVKVPR
jgi:hypothetical protein